MNMMSMVHYAPGDSPLCGSNCPDGALIENPQDVSGCEPCLELAAEDLADHNEYGGHCLTAAGRSPPEAESLGVGRRSGPVPTAVRRDGRPAARGGPELQKSGYIMHLRFSEVQCLPAGR